MPGVKLLLGTQASHTGALVQVLAAPVWIQLSANGLGEQQMMTQVLGLLRRGHGAEVVQEPALARCVPAQVRSTGVQRADGRVPGEDDFPG